jgi:hypothetical protein
MQHHQMIDRLGQRTPTIPSLGRVEKHQPRAACYWKHWFAQKLVSFHLSCSMLPATKVCEAGERRREYKYFLNLTLSSYMLSYPSFEPH